jgi:DNA repair exonuclease SbcCD ATPase subunit
LVNFDTTTLAAFGTMAGIIITVYYNAHQKRNDDKRIRAAELEQEKLQKEKEMEQNKIEKAEFAQKVDNSIEKGVKDLKEKIGDKIEPIRIAVESFEKRFDDYKIVNRDEIIDIRQRLTKLYEELDQLDRNKEGIRSNEGKFQIIRNQIEMLQKRINEIENQVSTGAKSRSEATK